MFKQPGNLATWQPAQDPPQEPAAGSSEHLCSSERLNSSERMSRGGVGVKSSRVVSIYIHIQPLKKITHSRGFYPTSTNPRTVYHTRSRSVTGYTYRNPSNLVYHKMSVYDFSFMIPFILYSLKELRLGLNCLMKLLPYGTQSITRNLGLYTYTKYFLLCISITNSILT